MARSYAHMGAVCAPVWFIHLQIDLSHARKKNRTLYYIYPLWRGAHTQNRPRCENMNKTCQHAKFGFT